MWPLNSDEIDHPFLTLISGFLGWTYFTCWSVSFYPQIISNFRRKSVTGLSIDYIIANLFGFLCYGLFNGAMYFSETARSEYRLRNDGNDNLVALNDVIFAWHATVMASVFVIQVLLYRKPYEGPSLLGIFLATSLTLIIILGFILVGMGWIDLLDFLYTLSYIKLVLTVIKCVPQAWMNWLRRSTKGFSIANVLLDFSGGILSISQLFLDAAISGHLAGIGGFLPKLVLGIISIIFDNIFILQHYVWFPHASTVTVGTTAMDGDLSHLAIPHEMISPEEGGREEEEEEEEVAIGDETGSNYKYTCNGN